MPIAFLALALTLWFPHAHANVRCVDASGKVSYQDRPCESTSRGAPLRLQENTVSGMPLSERLASRRSAASLATTAEEAIQLKCGNNWPGNTRMQRYCQDLQGAGLRNLEAPIPGASAELTVHIRRKCQSDWPDDYNMRAYCLRRNGALIGR